MRAWGPAAAEPAPEPRQGQAEPGLEQRPEQAAPEPRPGQAEPALEQRPEQAVAELRPGQAEPALEQRPEQAMAEQRPEQAVEQFTRITKPIPRPAFPAWSGYHREAMLLRWLRRWRERNAQHPVSRPRSSSAIAQQEAIGAAIYRSANWPIDAISEERAAELLNVGDRSLGRAKAVSFVRSAAMVARVQPPP
jgi:hypothetical protein